MRSFAQAAQTETEAVPLRTVQIEGSVALKIVKRCKECMPALVTGQLLGLHIGSILEVTNCFPFLKSCWDVITVGGLVSLGVDSSSYQVQMYQSTYMGSFQTVELIETLMNYQENIKRCVCIIYDPLRSSQGVLALKALKLAEGFMELYCTQNFFWGEVSLSDLQCDFDRLVLSTNPFMEKNLKFLIMCMDDLSMEQQRACRF
nr:eukaryotic translation initiation factor 3 subunit H-like [Physcomitrium patens]XP_024364987.1 eukaryotic translation initiation factor 3 subunit H-like [Physcomitrium patens]XP_024364988.1 eukaryotic translation initiation factor 3 subunit H-like [Physcomitrium patens]|eukprot:XP_024364986.1 eukaryotic translation initiation factor 3 subunit H-like [Physcomitrella patens]